jgi:hypothetical protein
MMEYWNAGMVGTGPVIQIGSDTEFPYAERALFCSIKDET